MHLTSLCKMQEHRVDRVMEIGQREAEETMRALAKVEGIFAGAQDLQKSCLRQCIAPCIVEA